MIWFSMKTCPLLWGVSLLLSMGTTGTPITDSTNTNSMVRADQTETAHIHHYEPEENSGLTHKPAEVTATPPMTMALTEVITNTQVQLIHTPKTSTGVTPPETTSITRSITAAMGTMLPNTGTTSPIPGMTSPTPGTTSPTPGMTSPTPGTTSPIPGTTSPTSASSSQGSSSTGTITLELFSAAITDSSPEVPSLTRKPTNLTVSETSSVKVNTATELPPALNHTSSFPKSRAEMPTASTRDTPPPLTQKPISATTPYMSTSAFPDTTKLHSPAESSSTNASTSETMVSNHSEGIIIPVSPRKLPVPTSKSVSPVTKMTESQPTTEVQPCSVRRIIKQCLIAVAVLAALATIFMVSTIILCVKLSGRKYRVKKPLQATEMMCISALLPERNHNYTRQRNPISNGVLVIPSGADSDDDGGDNLTLSSFLPENDRFV